MKHKENESNSEGFLLIAMEAKALLDDSSSSYSLSLSQVTT
jgi:hypothetical protein